MLEKQTMRHYYSTSLKNNLGATFQKLSTKPYDGEKEEKDNNTPFTNDYRKSRYIGYCLCIAKCFNAFKIKKFVVEISKETCNIYSQQKTNVFVSIRGLINDDIGDKSHKIKESIFSSGSHGFFFLFVQCLFYLPYTLYPYFSSSEYHILKTILLTWALLHSHETTTKRKSA